MAQHRLTAYLIEVGAALSLFLSFLLPWERELGSGLDVLHKALTTFLAIGFDPFNPDYVPLSQWWLVWTIPLVAAVITLRGLVGYMYLQIRLSYPRELVGLLVLFQGVVFAWLLFTFQGSLQRGYWLGLVAGAVLILTTLLELSFPNQSPEERYLASLPGQHIDRLWAGAYRLCPHCGEYNAPEAR
ncbi:MAG: hypothetical protein HC915_18575, partial [Anaerolineae bacterium]|nr:hypothetical protein [Anaerolineae bacterium]